MTANGLSNLSDGARAYLVPVGSVSGTSFGLEGPIPGKRFAAARVVIRDEGEIRLQETVEASALPALLGRLPVHIAGQLEVQRARLAVPYKGLNLPGREFPLAFTRPRIMGILNVTPDSFSDGGKFLDKDAAIRHARTMMAEGADIIDIGGESTRPGAKPVWEGEEAERVVPVIEALREEGVPLSVDTRHSFVMEKAVAAGASIINDVSALTYDGESLAAAARAGVPVVLMHSRGLPETMQDNPTYGHVLFEVYDYLEERIAACMAAGIAHEQLLVDPGIGFGKRVVQDNIALINGLPLFLTLGCPVLMGASRKRFIGAVTGAEDAAARMPGSVAAAIRSIELGAQIVRVHDVAETAQALKLTQAFLDAAIMDATA